VVAHQLLLPALAGQHDRGCRGARRDEGLQAERCALSTAARLLRLCAATAVSCKAFRPETHLTPLSCAEDAGFPRGLRKHSGYSLEEIESCAAYLVNLQAKAPTVQFKALYTKFKRSTFHSVARYPAPTEHFAGKNPTLPLPAAAPAPL